MKIIVIITTILVAQVSASFFDVFHGAVLSVQNSFGKLLSDVVTDVKDTVDCTILAVEHVLSLSSDATTRYYEKCASEANKTESVTEAPRGATVPKVELTLNLQNNDQYLQKLPAEIDARINDTLSKVLGNYKPYDNVLSIDNVLAKESEQLAGVSDLVKKELKKLSNEVTTDLKNKEKEKDSQPSVDTILQEIKVLEKREQNTKNNSEANEIHQVIDQVLGKLDAIEATEANENVKLEEILKDLERNSNNSFVGLRRQFEEWKEEESRHLSEIKSKIEEHEKISDHHDVPYNRHESDQLQPVILNKDMIRVDVNHVSSSSETPREALYNSTSSSEIGGSNNKGLIAVANETSPSPNNTLEDSGINDTMITRKSYSTTVSPIVNEVIHPFERPTSDKSTTPSTNQFTIAENHETIANTKLSVTDNVNETIQPFDSIADSNKQQSLATVESTPILSTDENKESVIMNNPTNTQGSNAIANIVLPIKSNNMDAASTENVKSSSLATNELANTSATHDDIESNGTMITSTTSSIHFRTPVNETMLPIESSTAASTIKTKIVSDHDSNNNLLPTFLPQSDSTMSENIRNEENALNSGMDKSKPEGSEKTNDTTITITLPTKKDTFVSDADHTVGTNKTSINEEISIDTTTEKHNYDLNNTMITNVSLPIVKNTVISENTIISSTVEPKTETNTASGIENYSNGLNEIIIMSTSLPIIDSALVTEAIQPKGASTTSGNAESSIMINNDSNTTLVNNGSSPTIENTSVSVTIKPENFTTASGYKEITESTTISKIENENSSDTTITSMLTPILTISESENIQGMDTTTVSLSEKESLDSPAIENPNAADYDDDIDPSDAMVTSAGETTAESKPEENDDGSENDETFMTTRNTQIAFPVTSKYTDSDSDVPDDVSNVNIDNYDTVMSTEGTTNSDAVAETNQIDETATASDEQYLSSTSTQSEENEIVTTRSRTEEDSGISPKLEENTFSRAPDIPDLNHLNRSLPLKTTENPLGNKEWSIPNKHDQQNDDTNPSTRNNYDINTPIPLSNPLLQTRQPIDPEEPHKMPNYNQVTMPTIKLDEKLDKAKAFAIFDAIDEQLSHSALPFGPEKDISKTVDIPSAPIIMNAPSKLIDPEKINDENSTFGPKDLRPTRPLNYVDDKAPEKGLTTHTPITDPRQSYKNPPMDYDSFLHMPPRDSEAHKRALQEALQLIANSKRSERIMNSIMKNKNKFKPKSIFR